MFCAAVFVGMSLASSAPPANPEQQAAQAIQKQLGVEFAVAESKIRRSIIRTKTPYGFKIKSIEPNSTASQAGWQVDDILMEWNATPIKNLTDLEEGLKKSAGDATANYKLSRYKKNQPALSRQPWEDVAGKIKLKS